VDTTEVEVVEQGLECRGTEVKRVGVIAATATISRANGDGSALVGDQDALLAERVLVGVGTSAREAVEGRMRNSSDEVGIFVDGSTGVETSGVEGAITAAEGLAAKRVARVRRGRGRIVVVLVAATTLIVVLVIIVLLAIVLVIVLLVIILVIILLAIVLVIVLVIVILLVIVFLVVVLLIVVLLVVVLGVVWLGSDIAKPLEVVRAAAGGLCALLQAILIFFMALGELSAGSSHALLDSVRLGKTHVTDGVVSGMVRMVSVDGAAVVGAVVTAHSLGRDREKSEEDSL
jgi:hypothetical protein